jgi:hypothetical protein
MRADRAISVTDRDRALPDGLQGVPDVKALGLAADEHRYRLEIARRLLRRLRCCGPHGLCGSSCCARRCNSIELQLRVGFGGSPLRLQVDDLVAGLCLRVFRLRLCLGRNCEGESRLCGHQLPFGSEPQILSHAHGHHQPCGFSGGCHRGEPRLVGLAGRFDRLGGAGGGQGAFFRLRGEQSRVSDLNGRYVARHDDHPHTQPGRIE